MELGEKLKQARLAAGLSQRQLCGDTITRNMLSLIENGAAQPSMDTLRFLAARLQKPLHYFLEDGEGSTDGWQLLKEEQYEQILNGAETQYQNPALLTLAALGLAQKAIAQNQIPYAKNLLTKSADWCQNAPGCSQELERKRLLLLFKLSPKDAPILSAQLSDDELLLRSAAAISQGNCQLSLSLLSCAQNKGDALWLQLAADSCFLLEDYAQAVSYYQQIEDTSLRRLEQCYEKLGDYRMAYHYACRQREL